MSSKRSANALYAVRGVDETDGPDMIPQNVEKFIALMNDGDQLLSNSLHDGTWLRQSPGRMHAAANALKDVAARMVVCSESMEQEAVRMAEESNRVFSGESPLLAMPNEIIAMMCKYIGLEKCYEAKQVLRCGLAMVCKRLRAIVVGMVARPIEMTQTLTSQEEVVQWSSHMKKLYPKDMPQEHCGSVWGSVRFYTLVMAAKNRITIPTWNALCSGMKHIQKMFGPGLRVVTLVFEKNAPSFNAHNSHKRMHLPGGAMLELFGKSWDGSKKKTLYYDAMIDATKTHGLGITGTSDHSSTEHVTREKGGFADSLGMCLEKAINNPEMKRLGLVYERLHLDLSYLPARPPSYPKLDFLMLEAVAVKSGEHLGRLMALCNSANAIHFKVLSRTAPGFCNCAPLMDALRGLPPSVELTMNLGTVCNGSRWDELARLASSRRVWFVPTVATLESKSALYPFADMYAPFDIHSDFYNPDCPIGLELAVEWPDGQRDVLGAETKVSQVLETAKFKFRL